MRYLGRTSTDIRCLPPRCQPEDLAEASTLRTDCRPGVYPVRSSDGIRHTRAVASRREERTSRRSDSSVLRSPVRSHLVRCPNCSLGLANDRKWLVCHEGHPPRHLTLPARERTSLSGPRDLLRTWGGARTSTPSAG